MKISFYTFLSCALLLLFSSCGIFGKMGRGRDNKLDSIIVRKDTSDRIVAKADTVRYFDTLPEANGFRKVVRYTKINGRMSKVDTVAKFAVRDTSSRPLVKVDSVRNFQPQLKNSYNVVILLPFMSAPAARTGESEAKSIRSLEFYEGVQLAYDSLRREGVNLNINVLDTRDSDSLLQTLLLRQELLDADLIIGPMSGGELRAVATFAQAQQKTLVSPLNPKEISDEDNPFFIQFNPTSRVQARNIFKYLEMSLIRKQKNIIIVGTKEDSVAMAQFQEEYAAYKKDPSAKVAQYMSADGKFNPAELKTQTRSGFANIVVVLSSRETFVYNLMRHLHESVSWKTGEISAQEDYIVFGQSQWKYFESVNPEYFESTRLHIVTECFADLSQPNVVKFKEAYFAKYGMPPREFGYVGFDLMLFFGRMLKKHGTGLRENLPKETYKGKHTTIKIEPLRRQRQSNINGELKTESVIHRYENSSVNIIKFEQFTFQKVF